MKNAYDDVAIIEKSMEKLVKDCPLSTTEVVEIFEDYLLMMLNSRVNAAVSMYLGRICDLLLPHVKKTLPLGSMDMVDEQMLIDKTIFQWLTFMLHSANMWLSAFDMLENAEILTSKRKLRSFAKALSDGNLTDEQKYFRDRIDFEICFFRDQLTAVRMVFDGEKNHYDYLHHVDGETIDRWMVSMAFSIIQHNNSVDMWRLMKTIRNHTWLPGGLGL